MERDQSRRRLAQAADCIRDRLIESRVRAEAAAERHLREAADAHGQLQAIARKLRVCARRGWSAAAGRLTSQAERVLRNLPYLKTRVDEALRLSRRPVPPLHDIVAELQAAEREFGGLGYDPAEATVSVVTDPIELEGIYLGEFEIRLLIAELGDHQPYRVIAQDPHPAASSEEVTHPHVSAERLCAGDASGPIREALESGRIGDLFVLVRSVLATYNAESPHVPLQTWYGAPCDGCGALSGEDGAFLCERCMESFCDECLGYCRRCERTQCRECLTTCSGCLEPVCDGCRAECAGCGQTHCTDCLGDGLCPTCLESLEDEDDEEHDDLDGTREGAVGQPAAAAATVQPDGVGEAGVLLPPR